VAHDRRRTLSRSHVGLCRNRGTLGRSPVVGDRRIARPVLHDVLRPRGRAHNASHKGAGRSSAHLIKKDQGMGVIDRYDSLRSLRLGGP
jgi:hypothetical protein